MSERAASPKVRSGQLAGYEHTRAQGIETSLISGNDVVMQQNSLDLDPQSCISITFASCRGARNCAIDQGNEGRKSTGAASNHLGSNNRGAGVERDDVLDSRLRLAVHADQAGYLDDRVLVRLWEVTLHLTDMM